MSGAEAFRPGFAGAVEAVIGSLERMAERGRIYDELRFDLRDQVEPLMAMAETVIRGCLTEPGEAAALCRRAARRLKAAVEIVATKDEDFPEHDRASFLAARDELNARLGDDGLTTHGLELGLAAFNAAATKLEGH